ncbi:MAG: hypothetical protein QNK25_06280, partial [Desulfobacterales bacterium]|nr:hypothetical protein [Desulfobacterales bacterium]
MRRFGMKIQSNLAIYVFATLLILSFSNGSAFAKKTVIMTHAMPTDHIFHKISERFIERLEELSGGSIEIEYHPGGDLGDLGDWT